MQGTEIPNSFAQMYACKFRAGIKSSLSKSCMKEPAHAVLQESNKIQSN